MGLTQWEKFVVERIPIPKITAKEQRPFVRLVDEILESKAANPDTDTSHLEWEIDRLVYDLYGLTGEEDPTVERSLGLIHTSDEGETPPCCGRCWKPERRCEKRRARQPG